ncbi:hypothetical protein JCM10207_001547 [Rhodosporidiobolus poonsookiae]
MTTDTPAAPATSAHSTVIITGAGLSGLDALVQLKRVLKVTDVAVFEKNGDLGGTWYANRYPGASCDIPIGLYSYSFEPATEFKTQWPTAEQICGYVRRVVTKFSVADRISYRTIVSSAHFSRSTGLWTVQLRNVDTGAEETRTCNVFVSAVGALSVPAKAPFSTEGFEGRVVHSAEWDETVDLEGKDVVVLGNGCSAAQIVPAILPRVKSLTQIARNKHTILAPNARVDAPFVNALLRYVPGLNSLWRAFVLNFMETFFDMADVEKGREGRKRMKQESDRYIEKNAPKQYWEQLKYDFEFGQKRRIIDFSSYVPSLHSPKFSLLLPDTIVSASGRTVTTEKGVEVPADLVILSTGFRVTDYLFPLSVYNSEGESLVERLKCNGVKTYLTSMVASYSNFFILMGPNSVTGHSSALFNTECTVEMLLKLLKPVVAALRADPKQGGKPAPTVEVTQEAEDEWYRAMRAEMEKKVWEMDGGISWYVDPAQGKCTTLYPWGQHEFQRQTRDIRPERFVYTGCDGLAKKA